VTPQTVFGGLREPLWPLLLVPAVRLLGSHSDIAIRMIGVLGFAFMVFAFQLLTRRLFGRTTGTVACVLLAACPWLVYQAARGLREETSAGLILVLCFALIVPKVGGRRFIALFALAGITGLLRWDAMVVMLPVIGLAMLIHRPPPVVWIAGPALLVLLVGPLLVANYFDHGDALYHSNIHARFFRNLEFHDQPGFPTSAEIAKFAFTGPPITWTQYVFGLHSPAVLAERAVRAFEIIPINVTTLAVFYGAQHEPLPGAIETAVGAVKTPVVLILWALAAAGGLFMIRTRAWSVPLILFGIILMYSPIAGLIDFRLVLTTLPLLAICAMDSLRASRWVPILDRTRESFGREYNALDAPERSI
jgi:4-amino-4-deoxy-L-arabinose transferase-like glycosyltransferase